MTGKQENAAYETADFSLFLLWTVYTFLQPVETEVTVWYTHTYM